MDPRIGQEVDVKGGLDPDRGRSRASYARRLQDMRLWKDATSTAS